MFDINTIINEAIASAVNAHINEALQQHANHVTALALRITSLEASITQGTALNNQTQCIDMDLSALKESVADTIGELDTLKQKVNALENNPAIGVDTTLERRIAALEGSKQISADAFVTHLDQQEWFWEKLARKAKEIADAAAENAVSDHCSDYDHDDYDRITNEVDDVDLSDVVTSDNLRDEIKSVLRDASVSIDV